MGAMSKLESMDIVTCQKKLYYCRMAETWWSYYRHGICIKTKIIGRMAWKGGNWVYYESDEESSKDTGQKKLTKFIED